MFKSDEEVKVRVGEPLGFKEPFAQGGSYALTLPKRVVRKFGLDEKISEGFFGFVFMDTDKGVLLVPLTEGFRPDSLKKALGFLKLSRITADDLKLLLEED